MTHDEVTKSFREATKAPPHGAQERVWRALNEPTMPARSPWVPVLALAASVLVGVLVVKLVQSPRTTTAQWTDERSAIVWRDAQATRTERVVTLEAGEVAVSSWGAPVEVSARGHVVRVEGGVAVVRVAGDSVSAEVIEGSLLLDGAEHVAKAKGVSSPVLVVLEQTESPALRSRRLLRRAEHAITEQRFDDARGDLETVATSGSLDAEVANFKKAELELRRLADPARALATLEAGEARFPSGALAQERQLTALESCTKLERWAEVERRATAFLAQHPDSERRAEIEALRDGARARVKSP